MEKLNPPNEGADVTGTNAAEAVVPGFRVSQAGHLVTSPLFRTQHPGHSQDPSMGLNLSKRDGFESVFVSDLAGSTT